jgi:hypothetical protein
MTLECIQLKRAMLRYGVFAVNGFMPLTSYHIQMDRGRKMNSNKYPCTVAM